MLHNLHITLFDLIDILAVACLIYWVLRLLRGTRALYMLLGLIIAVLLYGVSSFAELYTLNWILSNVFGSLLLVIVVLFQPDIRRMLIRLGSSPLFALTGGKETLEMAEELVRTAVSLANKKIGALIVLERDADVSDYIEIGVRMDAVLSRELLTSIFLPVSPLHDGAVLIQKGRITAAGCFLPLTMNPRFGVELGTRHRAALGLTEETDAVVLVISEEKGWISVCTGGKITSGLDGPALRKLLLEHFRPQASSLRRWWTRLRNASPSEAT